MSQRHTRLSVGVAVWFVLVGLVWWQYPTSVSADPSNPFAVAKMPPAVEVTMTVNRFGPGTVRVAAGATVTWRNTSDIPHTVTGDGFDSGLIAPGASYSRTFTQPGSYSYWCTPHRQAGMVGTVLVQR
jgi:plastocyanin